MRKLYYLEEIAKTIGEKYGDPNELYDGLGIENELNRSLRAAVLDGELICYNCAGRYRPKHDAGTFYTTAKAVNEWLESIESKYQFSCDEPEPEDKEPWWKGNSKDPPKPKYEWWTPARYFAREHKKNNPAFGHEELARLVETDLNEKKIFAQGKKGSAPCSSTILKALKGMEELKKDSKSKKKILKSFPQKAQ